MIVIIFKRIDQHQYLHSFPTRRSSDLTTASNVFTPPRMTFAMARDGQFFKMAGRVHPRFHTPGNALLIHLGLMILMVLRSEEHTSELQSQSNLVCRLLLEKKK